MKALLKSFSRSDYLVEAAAVALIVFASSALVWGFGKLAFSADIAVFAGFCIICALLFSWVRYPEDNQFLRILLSGNALIFVAFFAFSSLDFLLATLTDPLDRMVFQHHKLVSIAFGLIGLFRPSFLIVTYGAMHILWKGYLETGYGNVNVDWKTLVEAGSFLIFAIVLIACARGIHRLQAARFSSWRDAGWNLNICNLFICVGVFGVFLHFYIYALAGFEKLIFDGRPFAWIFENPTELLSANAAVQGFVPISHYEGLFAGFLLLLAGGGYIVINVLTVVSQIAGIVAWVHPRLMKWLCIILDASHVIIFFLSGIAFWKWLIFNVVIVIAAGRANFRYPPASIYPSVLAFLAVGHLLYFTPVFAWIDTRAQVRVELWAETAGGDMLRVPSNLFQGIAAPVAQRKLTPQTTQNFGTISWGTTSNWKTAEAADDCTLSDPDAGNFFEEQTKVDRFFRLVQTYHDIMLSKWPDSEDRRLWAYPHHIFSNPEEFRGFSEVNLHEIRGYHLEVIPSCTYVTNDGLVTRDFESVTAYLELTNVEAND